MLNQFLQRNLEQLGNAIRCLSVSNYFNRNFRFQCTATIESNDIFL